MQRGQRILVAAATALAGAALLLFVLPSAHPRAPLLARLVAPWHTSACAANEARIVEVLRAVHGAQREFVARRRVDLDRDGLGEFGAIRELLDRAPLRQAADGTSPSRSVPRIPSFSLPDVGGFANGPSQLCVYGRDGDPAYCAAVWLPGSGGRGVRAPAWAIDPFTAAVDADLAEKRWCAYAWPFHYGRTGWRTFFIDQDGELLGTDEPGYGDFRVAPRAGSAYSDGGIDSIVGRAAADVDGQDGNAWTRVR